jgi:hypothetical protein
MFEEDPNSGCVNEFKNCVSFGAKGAMQFEFSSGSTLQNNSWDLTGITASEADFASLEASLAKAPRQPDGSLPKNSFAQLVLGSDLIDKGVNLGLPYSGMAPDLGAFEYGPVGIAVDPFVQPRQCVTLPDGYVMVQRHFNLQGRLLTSAARDSGRRLSNGVVVSVCSGNSEAGNGMSAAMLTIVK